jgi:AmiR/NasT family two-component response regulator
LTGLGRRQAPSQYPDQEHDNVNQAVAAWHRVGLAQGTLTTRGQLTADQAFALLKRESQNTHVKLRTIAQTVIQTGDLPVIDNPTKISD